MQIIKYFEIFYLCLFKCFAILWICKMYHNNFHLHCAPLSTPKPEDLNAFLFSPSPLSTSFLYPLIQTQLSSINIRRCLLTDMANYSVAKIPQKMKNASPQENVKGQWCVRKKVGLHEQPHNPWYSVDGPIPVWSYTRSIYSCYEFKYCSTKYTLKQDNIIYLYCSHKIKFNNFYT